MAGSVPQARPGAEEAWTGRFPGQGPGPAPGHAVSSLEPVWPPAGHLPPSSPPLHGGTGPAERPGPWSQRPTASSFAQCPPRAVCGPDEAPLHTPAKAELCEVRAEVRADCPGPDGVATGPSGSASRLCRLSGLVPSAVNWGSCRDSRSSGGPSTCTVGPGGPCSCHPVMSRASLPQGTAWSQVLPLGQCPMWSLLRGRCHGGGRQVVGRTGACTGAQEARGAGWVDDRAGALSRAQQLATPVPASCPS